MSEPSGRHRLILAWPLVLGTAAALASAQTAPPSVKVRFYSSLVAGFSPDRTRGALKPLLDLVSSKVNYPIEFDLDLKGTGPEGILAFGKKVDDGTYHIGVVWGLEYGWLLQKYPQLSAMLVVDNGNGAPWRSQLMVPTGKDVSRLEQLRGKKLARFEGMALMDRLMLDELLRKEGQKPRGFFHLDEPRSSVRTAIWAVNNGEADCLMIDSQNLIRALREQPGLAKKLMPVKVSQDYPPPVVIGRREHLDKLRPGLWKRLQTEFIRSPETVEGQRFLRIWLIDALVEPTPANLDLIRKIARDIPIERLLNPE
jgi:ABC-type phosphate/phosphonate transport system substrate-binding protein